MVALFLAMLGGPGWAGHDVITIDGGGDPSAGLEIPGLGDVGSVGAVWGAAVRRGGSAAAGAVGALALGDVGVGSVGGIEGVGGVGVLWAVRAWCAV